MKISKVIYDTLQKDNTTWIPKRHNPSSASIKIGDRVIGPDLLTSYLKWTGVPPSNPIGPKALFKMKLGDGAHSEVAKILAKASIKSLAEVGGVCKIEGLKNDIGYRIDNLVEIDGQLEALELKSTTEDQMMGRGWGLKDKGPKEEHILQLGCYLAVYPGLKRGRLLYAARDSGDLLEFEVAKRDDTYIVDGNTTQLTWSGIVYRWKELEGYLERKEQPTPEHKAWLNDDGEVMPVKQIKGVRYKTDWPCLYSSYKDLIWKNPDNFQFTYNAEFKAKGLLK